MVEGRRPSPRVAWLLAACPVDSLRNGQEAVGRAKWACNATGWVNLSCLGTLAAACAEVGDFSQAKLKGSGTYNDFWFLIPLI